MSLQQLKAALPQFTIVRCFACGDRTTDLAVNNGMCSICRGKARNAVIARDKAAAAKRKLHLAFDNKALQAELKEVWD